MMKKKIIKEKLKEFGLNVTSQRVLVYSFLYENRIHPTAKDVFEGLKKEGFSLAKATIYNTLKKFAEIGIVVELNDLGLETRFELDLTPHIHFYCVKCGAVYDLKEAVDIYKKTKIEEHKILEFHLNIKGICKECLKKEN